MPVAAKGVIAAAQIDVLGASRGAIAARRLQLPGERRSGVVYR
ncbi:hypothetical protein [Xanthomonas hortorum]|nr:hypothetical protein [Xanthomonas hortorum]